MNPAEEDGRPESFTRQEWAQAGKVLVCCSGLACVALSLYRGDGLLDQALRTWVGLFGGVLSLFAVFSARRSS